MEKLIISNIKDTFDDVMEDYINSPTYQEERRNVNAMFLKLRGELTPEQASCLNDILNAVDNSNNQLALEALARGVLNLSLIHI